MGKSVEPLPEQLISGETLSEMGSGHLHRSPSVGLGLDMKKGATANGSRTMLAIGRQRDHLQSQQLGIRLDCI